MLTPWQIFSGHQIQFETYSDLSLIFITVTMCPDYQANISPMPLLLILNWIFKILYITVEKHIFPLVFRCHFIKTITKIFSKLNDLESSGIKLSMNRNEYRGCHLFKTNATLAIRSSWWNYKKRGKRCRWLRWFLRMFFSREVMKSLTGLFFSYYNEANASLRSVIDLI